MPTNIVHLATSLKCLDSAGVDQILLYDEGVGTGGGSDSIIGGYTGKGLDANIKQLYSFIAMNYNDGDEVYLFGFSRGAYTVRSLAGMLYVSGLVSREHLAFAQEAYDMYRSGVGADSETAETFRAEHSKRVKISLLACFDTVGALGLPKSFLSASFNERYRFHNVKINPSIENAIHLLSIDENRVRTFLSVSFFRDLCSYVPFICQ